MTSQNDIFISAPKGFSMVILDGMLGFANNDMSFLPKQLISQSDWGTIQNFHKHPKTESCDLRFIELTWVSLVEKKIYSVEIGKEGVVSFDWDKSFDNYLIGIAPYGSIAIWGKNKEKSMLLNWSPLVASTIPDDELVVKTCKTWNYYLNRKHVNDKSQLQLGVISKDSFFKNMQQFTCRYLLLFEHWDKDKQSWWQYDGKEIKLEFDYIEESLFDGTHDKLHDGGLMNYHQAGKPKKLAVKWHIKKSEYTAYFWFEDEAIRNIFNRFYGAHPETKTDFMIRIDSEKNKYELALYRYGLKEPQVISESAYQLLVFKNKFEYYRSENYNQPKGAWIW